MPYNEALAQRVKDALGPRPDLVERRMFGGVGFLVSGNMACGVHGQGLIVRVGPEGYAEVLSNPVTRPFDLTGRPMKGWVVVDASHLASDDALDGWVQRGLQFALSLPPK